MYGGISSGIVDVIGACPMLSASRVRSSSSLAFFLALAAPSPFFLRFFVGIFISVLSMRPGGGCDPKRGTIRHFTLINTLTVHFYRIFHVWRRH